MTDRLWTPWRGAYVSKSDRTPGCIFCDKPASDDDAGNLLLYRGERAFVLMNLYPYNTGHVMVAPYAHASDLAELDPADRAELLDLAARCTAVIRAAMAPHGFNLGMNVGAAAGAGIADHLHLHVVPRWNGDTNFMPVLADTKVMPETLAQTYEKLLAAFATT